MTDFSSYAASGLEKTDSVSWNTDDICDNTKWASATACHGVGQPWQFSPSVAPTPDTKGFIQAWHWLADWNPTDPTKLFRVEKDHVLNMMVYQKVGLFPMRIDDTISYFWNPTTDGGAYDFRCGSMGKVVTEPHGHAHWGVSTYTVSGATQTLISAATTLIAVYALI